MAGMQIGSGRAYRDGVLGGVMQEGPGYAMRDGILGGLGVMQTGPGHAMRDGSLGAALQTGPGYAMRDGSLGGGCVGGCGSMGAPSDITIGDLFSLDLIIGAAVGGAVVYLYLTSSK